MNTTELKILLDQQAPVRVIDVREPDEFAEGAIIPESENLPMNQAIADASAGTLPKDQKIIVVCRSGGRSGVVMQVLKEHGYDVENLEGGIEAWNII